MNPIANKFSISIQPGTLSEWKKRILSKVNSESVSIYLDSNEFPIQKHQRYECLAAGGVQRKIETPAGSKIPAFEGLKYWLNSNWAFGYFGYDLKNQIENLNTHHPDRIGFPDMFFFEPLWVISIDKSSLIINIEAENAAEIAAELQLFTTESEAKYSPEIELLSVFEHADYIDKVNQIRQLIVEGDLYEMNLCRELFAENVSINPHLLFQALNQKTKAPFASYFKTETLHLLCGSPQRFIYKSGDQFISQPIKGTRPRNADETIDTNSKLELQNAEKDRAENVMIVDLVRNDFAKNAVPGTVTVEELFGIYSFETVHQMISTISGKIKPGIHPVDAIEAAFPMGSMTGAPKVRAMQRIEEMEKTRRGIYSGALGYFNPEGDFDFNVVIRSLMYHESLKTLSCQVGGAIVYDSEPEVEWMETEWKAKAIRQVLNVRFDTK